MDHEVDFMKVPDCSIIEYDGHDVAIIRLKERMEVLSSAVLNGGNIETDHLFIMEVPKNFMHDDPSQYAADACESLGLPSDSVGLMTAAEVGHVFNHTMSDFSGTTAFAAATAGLSNQVVAGEPLEGWGRRHELSNQRSRDLIAGTINIIGLSSLPMTQAAKVNIMIAMTEAKTAALHSFGYKETGTTSDAIAIVSPIGDSREEYAGTGTPLGIAMARSVKHCVRNALIRRGDDSRGSYLDILADAGLSLEVLKKSISETLETDLEDDWVAEKLENLKSNKELATTIQIAVDIEEAVSRTLKNGTDDVSMHNTLPNDIARSIFQRTLELVLGQTDINRQYPIYNKRIVEWTGEILDGALQGIIEGMSLLRNPMLPSGGFNDER